MDGVDGRLASAALSSGKELVPIVQEAGWAPRPVWTGAENLVPTGIRFPDRPARNKSLYRLSHPAINAFVYINKLPIRCTARIEILH